MRQLGKPRLAGGVQRSLDLCLAALALTLLLPLMLAIALAVWLETGSPLFRQTRVGWQRRTFTLYKFRTMRPGTPSLATHLVDPAGVTRVGRWLRRWKLDELPQLWNVLKGDMSLVGPRPCLPEQGQLIAERDRRGVYAVRPGITGLAQLSGIDMSEPERLAKIDAEMVQTLTLARYISYLWSTLLGRGAGDPLLRPRR